jgi:hypothetical protein
MGKTEETNDADGTLTFQVMHDAVATYPSASVAAARIELRES